MSAETLPQDTLRAAVLKALSNEVGTEIKTGKAGLRPVMDALDIDTLGARLPDGTRVAKVRRAGGGTTAQVTDEAAFLRWVIANRPGEIVQAVRESYRKALLEAAAKAGPDAADKKGRPLDPETGEPVDGIGFAAGTAYLTVNFEPGGEDAIRAAWQSGRLSLDAMLALPAAGGDADV